MGGSGSILGSILVAPCEQTLFLLFLLFVSIRMRASPPAAQLRALCRAVEGCSALRRAVGQGLH